MALGRSIHDRNLPPYRIGAEGVSSSQGELANCYGNLVHGVRGRGVSEQKNGQ